MQYKGIFDERWLDEKYKWEAIKWFQEHWNIKAEDFSGMFSKATEKTVNLLASVNNYPRKMIIDYAKQQVNIWKIILFLKKDILQRISRETWS